MAKLNSWDKYRKKSPEETAKYRDVYSDQQVDRSDIPEQQSPTSRIIFVTIVAIVVFVAAYFFLSLASYGKAVMAHAVAVNAGTSGGSQQTEIPADIDISGVTVTDEEVVSFARGQNYVEWPKVLDDGTQIQGWSMASDDTFLTQEEMTDLCKRQIAWEALQKSEAAESKDGAVVGGEPTLSVYLLPTGSKLFWSVIIALAVWSLLYQIMMKNLAAQNVLSDTASLNQYKNDQHIAFPEEVMEKFDWFPDSGAHCNVQVSSMISHVFLQNKGLKKIAVAERASKDILDEDGDIEYLKGEILLDDDGNPITKSMPLIDSKYGDALYTASGTPENKKFRIYYDATAIKYNPGGKDRSKQGGEHDTVAKMINADWEYPLYEVQRPAGAYLVDTEPVNTIKFSKTAYGVINA